MTLRLAVLVAVFLAHLQTLEGSSWGTERGAFELELALRPSSSGTTIEVRLTNTGAPARLVNKRFAFATPGNPVAELSFEADPPSPTGCRFNLRPASATDFVLLGTGEFVGRSLSTTALLCFAGNADTIKVRAHYEIKKPIGVNGPVLEGHITSNQITLPRDALGSRVPSRKRP